MTSTSTRTRAPPTAHRTSHSPPPTDELTSLGECCVCQDADAPSDNPIVYCDVCNCGVHVQCYGYPLITSIPSSSWICQSCLASASPPPSSSSFPSHAPAPAQLRCSLCPSPASFCPLKRTTTGGWAHLCCALWIPEVFFRLSEGCDGIDLTQVGGVRRGRLCHYCGVRGVGVCGECTESSCGRWYHVTCGMRHGILLEYRHTPHGDVIISLCHQHARRWRKPRKK